MSVRLVRLKRRYNRLQLFIDPNKAKTGNIDLPGPGYFALE